MNSTPITFAGIFNSTEATPINTIEIPIIQRDYAQGRESKEVGRIRSHFLLALHSALTGKSEPIKLDFVYGNVSDGKLIPLDGQQRLTTLFLLHWYIAKKENINSQQYAFLNGFTYRTRFSSAHFCKNLVAARPDFSRNTLSGWIKDQSWYMFAWDYDPTICAMLVVLDGIHALFKDTSGLWERLTNEDTPPISFYFLKLNDMGLTDSLYIKMNSRGKPLTPFEHFKAEIEATIKSVSADLYKEFIQKVDNDWVDMLWKYRGEDGLTDDEFMRYYRFVTEMICFEQEIEIIENDFDLSERVYGKENKQAASNLRFLFNAFDCWKGLDIAAFFNGIFSKNSHEIGKVSLYAEQLNLFLECCNKYGALEGRQRKFSLINTLLLYAVLIYQMNKSEVSPQDLENRIRILRNLAFNSPDEVREDRMKALLSDIKEIMLSGTITSANLGFNELQKGQEIEKMEHKKQHPELVLAANALEDHPLLQGNIAIVDFSDPIKFSSRASNFSLLFDGKIDYITISRALLTLGDYSQLISWRFLFGSKSHSSWRELFMPSKTRKHFERTKKILQYVLDSPSLDADYLQTLINNFLMDANTPKDWRYYFIKYPSMRSGDSGTYWWKNDPDRVKDNAYEIVMMNTPRTLNGRHWDPFLLVLSEDADLKKRFTLADFGAPLVDVNKNERIRSANSAWCFYGADNKEVIRKIDIPQEQGIDLEDRVELLKRHLMA